MSPEETCAVCGRTILAGEQVRAYLAADGRRVVCALCRARAERLGWRPEGEGSAREPEPDEARPRRGGGLRGLFRGRANRPSPATEAAPREPDSSPDPAAPGMRAPAPPPEPFLASPFERAVERFNPSEAGRTVAGLARTLGDPWVSVGASAGAPGEVRITVAWELSWYQWGVDLGDELRPVFALDKGLEVSQLDAAARQWNASALEGGRIVLAAPAHGVAADGEPVGR